MTPAQPADVASLPDELQRLLSSIQNAVPSAHAEAASDPLFVVVGANGWQKSVEIAVDRGYTCLEFLTAADYTDSLRVVALLSDDARRFVMLAADVTAHASAAADGSPDQTVKQDATARPSLPSLSAVFANAGWHERETAEMFGIHFDGNTDLRPLLLQGLADRPEGEQAPPLRRATALADRLNTAWPGAKSADPTATKPRRIPPSPGVHRDWPQP